MRPPFGTNPYLKTAFSSNFQKLLIEYTSTNKHIYSSIYAIQINREKYSRHWQSNKMSKVFYHLLNCRVHFRNQQPLKRQFWTPENNLKIQKKLWEHGKIISKSSEKCLSFEFFVHLNFRIYLLIFAKANQFRDITNSCVDERRRTLTIQ